MNTNQDQNESSAPQGAGTRLREAREAAGLSQADVAARLKMPVRVVRSLEDEDWSRLGAPVYVRGQLRSYARLLGITTGQVEAAAGVSDVAVPVLTPRTFISPLQRFAEQAARRLVYIVMTIAIAIPVWLATRPHLDTVTYNAAPLDVPATADTRQARSAQPVTRQASAADPHPLVASLASFPAREQPMLSLQISGDSWIHVTDGNGHTVEQALLHAGDRRSYDAGEVASVVLGNAEVVQVRNQGRQADLAPFLRANVARFTVSSDGSLAPAAD